MCDSTLFPTKGLGTRLTIAKIIFAVYSVAVLVLEIFFFFFFPSHE